MNFFTLPKCQFKFRHSAIVEIKFALFFFCDLRAGVDEIGGGQLDFLVGRDPLELVLIEHIINCISEILPTDESGLVGALEVLEDQREFTLREWQLGHP